MMTALYFILIAVISYLIGTINFARIVSWMINRKDITQVGSKNPGTMNVIRNLGFIPGMLTLLAEVVKTGLCCVLARFCMQGVGYAELAFYFSGIFVVIGNSFPVFFHFKGGKGVACLGGMFMFSNLWWVGLILFAFCVVLILITDYGFLSSLTFIIGMSIATTVWAFVLAIPYAWAITLIVWLGALLTVVKHRGNIYRFVKGCENKSNFKKSFLKLIKKNKDKQPDAEIEKNTTDENNSTTNDKNNEGEKNEQ